MPEITPSQIRAIHAALHFRGIEDSEYRELLQSHWQVGTCKDLDRSQANELLNLLNPGGKRKGKSKRRTATRRRPIKNAATAPDNSGAVVHLATQRQRALIEALQAEIVWRTDDGFRNWMRKALGLSQVRTRADAQRVIQGLKGLKRYDGHAVICP